MPAGTTSTGHADSGAVFGVPRTAVLVAGTVYLVAAIALWALLLATGGVKNEDDLGAGGAPPAQQGSSANLGPPSVPAGPEQLSLPTSRVDRARVELAVARAAGATTTDGVLCAAGSTTGVGGWTCTISESGAALRRSARLDVHEDGSYAGVLTDQSGVERPFADCCIPVGR